MNVSCPQCDVSFDAETGRVNRARKIGSPLYCGRRCAGLAHRRKNPPTEAERREAKSHYDREYRSANLAAIKQKKSDYFKRNYNPEKASFVRKERMHLHVEYCRRPEYKASKSEYDKQHRAKKNFGEFAEASLLLQVIEKEIEQLANRYEIGLNKGTINKAQKRRRAL